MCASAHDQLVPNPGMKTANFPTRTDLIVVSFHHLEKFDDVLPAPNVKWTLNDTDGGILPSMRQAAAVKTNSEQIRGGQSC